MTIINGAVNGGMELINDIDADGVDCVVVVVDRTVLASNWSWAVESDVDDVVVDGCELTSEVDDDVVGGCELTSDIDADDVEGFLAAGGGELASNSDVDANDVDGDVVDVGDIARKWSLANE